MLKPLRVAFVLVLLQTASAQQPAPSRGAVEGVVVDRLTGMPLPGIAIKLSGIVGVRVETYTTATGKDGKFLVKDVLPGPGYWLIAASREAGYLPTVYAQRGLTGPGAQIALAPGQQIKDVRLALTPTGTIAGRILDSQGKPVSDRTVHAVSPSYDGGRWVRDASDMARGGTMRSSRTNRRGEYRIAALPPGQYYVSIGGSGTGYMVGSVRNNPYPDTEGYAPTFYPGTMDPRAALPIAVHAAGNIKGLDIKIVPEHFRRVRGVVVNGTTGGLISSAQVIMVPRDAPANSGYAKSLITDKGSFEIGMLFPGSYFIVAFASDGGRRLSGRVTVEVGKTDLDKVTVAVAPGLDIRGRIILDEPGGAKSPEGLRVGIRLRPDPPSNSGILPPPLSNNVSFVHSNATGSVHVEDEQLLAALAVPTVSATMEPGGAFSFRSVVPWDYHFEVSSTLEDAYVRSIRLGDVDALSEGLHVDATPVAELQVVLDASGGALEGRVLGGKLEGVDNVKVVLVPAVPLRRRNDLYRSAWTDSSGAFKVHGIPPGDYTLYAWEHVEEGAWRDPEFLRLYPGQGTPVHIRERTTEKVETRLIPPWL